MGDLFGPYHVAGDVFKSATSEGSPGSPTFRSPVKNTSQDLAMKFILGGSDKGKRKRKKSADNRAASTAANEGHAEVWFHEDCVCWCPDIRIVGNVVLGLDDAISATQRAPCSKCHLRGSTLGCVANGCRETAHFHCAKSLRWTIDEEIFQARCAKHAKGET